MLLLGLHEFLTAGSHRRAAGSARKTVLSNLVSPVSGPVVDAWKNRLPRWLRVSILVTLLIGIGGFLTMVIAGHVMTSSYTSRSLTAVSEAVGKADDPRAMAAKIRRLEKKIAALAPKGVHVVVDTAANRLYLKNGEKLMREAVISCGSGMVLPNPFGGRDWIFDTPRGERTVRGKTTNPVWTKPDWAFIEEGEPIPKNREDRIEAGVLGDYALAIGNGYLLHGTLYKRMLGRNVSHGCIRIGDEDLEALYRNVPVGAKVFLY